MNMLHMMSNGFLLPFLQSEATDEEVGIMIRAVHRYVYEGVCDFGKNEGLATVFRLMVKPVLDEFLKNENNSTFTHNIQPQITKNDEKKIEVAQKDEKNDMKNQPSFQQTEKSNFLGSGIVHESATILNENVIPEKTAEKSTLKKSNLNDKISTLNDTKEVFSQKNAKNTHFFHQQSDRYNSSINDLLDEPENVKKTGVGDGGLGNDDGKMVVMPTDDVDKRQGVNPSQVSTTYLQSVTTTSNIYNIPSKRLGDVNKETTDNLHATNKGLKDSNTILQSDNNILVVNLKQSTDNLNDNLSVTKDSTDNLKNDLSVTKARTDNLNKEQSVTVNPVKLSVSENRSGKSKKDILEKESTVPLSVNLSATNKSKNKGDTNKEDLLASAWVNSMTTRDLAEETWNKLAPLWNELDSLRKARGLTEARRVKINKLLKKYRMEEILEGVSYVGKSAFLLGKTNMTVKDGKQVRGWAATVDWFLDHFDEIYEGKYTDTEDVKSNDEFHDMIGTWVKSGVVCRGA